MFIWAVLFDRTLSVIRLKTLAGFDLCWDYRIQWWRSRTLAGSKEKVKVRTKYTFTSYSLEIAPMSGFNKGHLSQKVIFQKMLSSIKVCFPTKGFFHQRLYSRKLSLNFGQNLVNNSGDIADIFFLWVGGGGSV